MTSVDLYWQQHPNTEMEMEFHDGKAIGEMAIAEVVEVFRDACWNELETTKAFILVYAGLKPELYEAIQEKYPEYLL